MTGVQTNAKGNYAIHAFIGDVLVFSYIDFHTVEVTVDENNVYNLNTIPFDKYGYDLLLTTEANKIILVNRKELLNNQGTFQMDQKLKQNVRLLIEWNHPDGELKLRIVSPDDYYNDWNTPKLEA